MNQSLTELAARFLRGQGLADVPLNVCRKLLPSCPRPFTLIRTTTDPAEALTHLSTLTFPDSRHVVFPAGPSLSVFVNNRRAGSDYADYRAHLPKQLQCRFVRLVNVQRQVWKRGADREVLCHETRIFELHDSLGEPIRIIYAADDGGRWVTGSAGVPHPDEPVLPWDAKRKKDRLTVEHLHQILRAYRFPVVAPEHFLTAGTYDLYEAPVKWATGESCTLEEVDDPAYGYFHRGLNWTRHMQTHAASVISDFERCVRLNPAYRDKVQGYLEEAYRYVRGAK